MWWAGLRGAIAVALACQVPGPCGPRAVATTMVIVILTIFVLGGSTKAILDRLHIQTHAPAFDESAAMLTEAERRAHAHAFVADAFVYDLMVDHEVPEPAAEGRDADAEAQHEHNGAGRGKRHLEPFVARLKVRMLGSSGSLSTLHNAPSSPDTGHRSPAHSDRRAPRRAASPSRPSRAFERRGGTCCFRGAATYARRSPAGVSGLLRIRAWAVVLLKSLEVCIGLGDAHAWAVDQCVMRAPVLVPSLISHTCGPRG